jgi:predicted dienelactone hydrolase
MVARPALGQPRQRPAGGTRRAWSDRRVDRATGKTGRLVAATGHSLGGITAQALAGARTTPLVLQRSDPRIKAVLALSPPGTWPDFISADTWRDIRVPCLVQTGTADTQPGFTEPWTQHLLSLENASSADKWSVVGEGVDHTFGGLICYLRDDSRKQLPALEAVVETSALFRKTYVSGDAESLRQLQASAASGIAEPAVQVRHVSL